MSNGSTEVITQFVLAGGQEIADYNGAGAGAAIMLTVRGAGGLPVAGVTLAVDGATLTAVYYHHDVTGSTVAATVAGTSGAADIYTYGEFGAPGAGTWATYRFAGYRYDNETGLYYVNARYYSPNLGRFLQTDPIGLSGGTNLYAYVGNDPINLIDPTGLSQQEAGNDSGNNSAASGNSYSILTASYTSAAPAMWVGAAIGEGIDPLGGGVVGAILGSFIGVGGTPTYVPETSSYYLGGTAQFTTMPMGGNSLMFTETGVTNPQDADVSGLSYAGSAQPLSLAGAVVTYTPASSSWTLGAEQSDRFPYSVSVTYNFNITPAVNAVHNVVSNTVNTVKGWFH